MLSNVYVTYELTSKFDFEGTERGGGVGKRETHIPCRVRVFNALTALPGPKHPAEAACPLQGRTWRKRGCRMTKRIGTMS